jgi:hypothetical protein
MPYTGRDYDRTGLRLRAKDWAQRIVNVSDVSQAEDRDLRPKTEAPGKHHTSA